MEQREASPKCQTGRWAAIALGVALALAPAGCSSSESAGGGGGTSGPVATQKVLTTIDGSPRGASVFVDGGFVGVAPATFHLPAKKSVEVRVEMPGFVPYQTTLYRAAVAPGAEDGVGWDDLYYFELTKKQ